jgi:hypothetical protein
MSEPRTTREALIAHMLGDLDTLLTRSEQLPRAIADAEARIALSAEILDKAGEKYRLAVASFTAEARKILTEHVQHKASETVECIVEEQRAVLREAARVAFNDEAAQHAAGLRTESKPFAQELRRHASARLLEHGVTALLASVLTATLVLLVIRLS